MIERVLADFVLALHLAFVVFVVVGGLLTLRWRFVPWVHLPAAVWGAAIEISGGVCPLTPLENALRRAAGQAGYPGGFIEHYLLGVLYPSGLTQSVQWLLAGLVVLANLLIYGIVCRALRARGTATEPPR